MSESCRSWWRNCAVEADPEIRVIDAMEDQIAPIGAEVAGIRELISSLELCHHKAERWIQNLIEAIASGQSNKGLGTRPTGQRHPAESVWQNACTALEAWCAGYPGSELGIMVGSVTASELVAHLGDRSPLKEWQVHRVIEKIRGFIGWPQSLSDSTAPYSWILLGGSEYELAYRDACPGRYTEHEELWLATVRTTLHDSFDGRPAELSLGLAIDMLMPCHWRFVDNLRIVLDAIGGRLYPDAPFAACGRNIDLSPLRERMQMVSQTLRTFASAQESDDDIDPDLLSALGHPTEAKKWLALSLDKTIRLQLDPPASVRAISALTGPEWIDER